MTRPRKIDRNDVALLNVTNYYDGPLQCTLRWNDERFWFEKDHCDRGDDWTLLLYRLSEDEWAYEDERHAAFREHVGTHCDYDPVTQQRPVGSVRPGGMDAWRAYYDDPRWRQKRNYADREPVAAVDL